MLVVINVQHIEVYHALNEPKTLCRLELRKNWPMNQHVSLLCIQPFKVVYLCIVKELFT